MGLGFGLMVVGAVGYVFLYLYARMGDFESVETAMFASDLSFLALIVFMSGAIWEFWSFGQSTTSEEKISFEETEREIEDPDDYEEIGHLPETFFERHPIIIFALMFIIILIVSVIALSSLISAI
jgi:uncharacterized membrane protein